MQEAAKAARPGETIYKGHHSYDLMRNLQLGILFSIAKTSKALQGQPSPPLAAADFRDKVAGLRSISLVFSGRSGFCLFTSSCV